MKKRNTNKFVFITGKKNSVETQILNTVFTSWIIVVAALLITGIILFMRHTLKHNITTSLIINRNAALILSGELDIEKLCRNVTDPYFSLTKDEREQAGNEIYAGKFESIEKDKDYLTAIRLLDEICSQSVGTTDTYLGMYDQECNQLVYIADPSKDDPRKPGDIDRVAGKEAMTFLAENDKDLYDLSISPIYGWSTTSGVPLYDKEGNIYAFVITDMSLADMFRGINGFILFYFIISSIVALSLVVKLTNNVRTRLIKPINDITSAATHYIYDRRVGVSNNAHFSSLEITSGEELQKMVLVMADMEREVSEYEENIRKTVAEREKLRSEMELAARIQANAIPCNFPDRKDFNIYASMNPAKEVGGDFYDFFMPDDNHLGLVIADVSGKGVPAALFMMRSIILMNTLSMSGYDPAEVFDLINKRMSTNNPDYMFVTAWLGLLDLRTGKLTACNAGHEYPIIKKPNGTYEIIQDYHEFVIGGFSKIKYKNYELLLEPGSVLYVYTDGVVEALNSEGEVFGMDRLMDSLNRTKDTNPQKTIEAVSSDINKYIAETPQYDDITMMCLQYNGPHEPV